MRVLSKEIRQEFKAVWPGLEYVWIFDQDWWKPSLEQIERLMERSRTKEMKFIPSFNDCDNFALQFMAEVHRIRYFAHMEDAFPDEQLAQASIFTCAGTIFRGIAKNHVCNVACLREGIYMIDTSPGEQRAWKAADGQDDIYFVTSI